MPRVCAAGAHCTDNVFRGASGLALPLGPLHLESRLTPGCVLCSLARQSTRHLSLTGWMTCQSEMLVGLHSGGTDVALALGSKHIIAISKCGDTMNSMIDNSPEF